MPGPPPAPDTLRILYERNERNWRFFLEYRYRLLTRFLIASGLCLGIEGWVLDTKHYPLLFAGPSLICIIAIIFYQLERRTSLMLVICHHTGRVLEHVLLGDVDAGPLVPRPRRAPATGGSDERTWIWNRLRKDAENHLGFFQGFSRAFKLERTHSEMLLLVYRACIEWGGLVGVTLLALYSFGVGDAAGIVSPQQPVGCVIASIIGVMTLLVLLRALWTWRSLTLRRVRTKDVDPEQPAGRVRKASALPPLIGAPSMPATSNADWLLEQYHEGSAACRNYSKLTMQVRTLTVKLFLAGGAALAALLAMTIGESDKNEMWANLLRGGGLVLQFAAPALLLVCWHYQSAFEAIRDVLASIEHEAKPHGPWVFHLRVRSGIADLAATWLPFAVLWVTGWFSWLSAPRECPRGWLYWGMWVSVICFATVCIWVARATYLAKRDRRRTLNIHHLEGYPKPGPGPDRTGRIQTTGDNAGNPNPS